MYIDDSEKGKGEDQKKEEAPIKKAPADPLSAIVGMSGDFFKIAEIFGIEKKDVGKMALKALFTGQLSIPGFSVESAKRRKIEILTDSIIKLAWTMFGIFMIFQVFIVLTEHFI